MHIQPVCAYIYKSGAYIKENELIYKYSRGDYVLTRSKFLILPLNAM